MRKRKHHSLTADLHEMLSVWHEDEERLEFLTEEKEIDKMAYRILIDQLMYRFLLRVAKEESEGPA